MRWEGNQARAECMNSAPVQFLSETGFFLHRSDAGQRISQSFMLGCANEQERQNRNSSLNCLFFPVGLGMQGYTSVDRSPAHRFRINRDFAIHQTSTLAHTGKTKAGALHCC